MLECEREQPGTMYQIMIYFIMKRVPVYHSLELKKFRMTATKCGDSINYSNADDAICRHQPRKEDLPEARAKETLMRLGSSSKENQRQEESFLENLK